MKIQIGNCIFSFLFVIVIAIVGCSKKCQFDSMPAHCWTGQELLVWNGTDTFMAFNPELNNWRSLSNNLYIEGRANDPHLAFIGNDEIVAVYWKTQAHKLLCIDFYNIQTDKWEKFATIENDNLKDQSIVEKNKIVTAINGIVVIGKRPIVIIESRYGFSKVVCLKINRDDNCVTSLHADKGPIHSQTPALHVFKNKFLYFGSQNPTDISWSVWDDKRKTWTTSQPIDVIYGFGHASTGESVYIYGGSIKYGSGETWNGFLKYSFVNNTIKKLSSVDIRKRRNCVMCWSGKEILIWGGFDIEEGKGFSLISDQIGIIYNPVRNKWIPISDENAPSPRFDSICYWTGKEMMIWSGYNGYKGLNKQLVDFEGYAYNPEKKQWRKLMELPE